jgi:starch phosphorylase
MTKPIFTFKVKPSLPDRLMRLHELAYNLMWAWDYEMIDLFRRLDRDLWEESGHNPVLMLGTIRQDRLEALAQDDGFLAHLERVCQRYDQYMKSQTSWYQKTYPAPPAGVSEGRTGGDSTPLRVAYFSAEFGLTECLPNYSGGMGILAGDHLKSSSDLGLPVVGIGLLYQQGYFRQYLNADGWQQETYPLNDFYVLPLHREERPDGTPVTIEVEYPGRMVKAQVWRAQVGRVPLYLLDTNLSSNAPADQDITDQLYGGDLEMRIKQEIMLGIGGLRALEALGLPPTVCHMNEGHSAFLGLERIRQLMVKHGISFPEAREAAVAGNAFTTHTPVLAGNDYFPPELMDKYFSSSYKALGLSRDEFLALGREKPADSNEWFCMTILALRLSGRSNGVSLLHGTVARRMWQGIWPGLPEDAVPITSISNGIHAPSWISHDMADLYDRYLGPRWHENPGDQALWNQVHQIPDEELWRTHERRRERLVAVARRRLRAQLESRGAPPSEIAQADEVLSPEALTIGFARRFATYKRATLLLHDPQRLTQILTDRERPVQIIFAGKAHPRDNEAKELIRQIIHFERQPEIRRRMVFIEDYDMVVARYLLQGVDVWLNTPRRPLEASGTSGMKATVNGALNLSVLDGWWAEGYNVNTGWAIGRGEEYTDEAYQDYVEANAVYDLLEKEIIPLFYTRGPDGLPRGWIARMKAAMRAICPFFNTNRMAREYTGQFYLPAAKRYLQLSEDGLAPAIALAAWKARVVKQWPNIKITQVQADKPEEVVVGAGITVHAWLSLGELTPDDVDVQLYQGAVDAKGDLAWPKTIPMNYVKTQDGLHEFVGIISCQASGLHGYTVHVLPKHDNLNNPYEMGLILWAS